MSASILETFEDDVSDGDLDGWDSKQALGDIVENGLNPQPSLTINQDDISSYAEIADDQSAINDLTYKSLPGLDVVPQTF